MAFIMWFSWIEIISNPSKLCTRISTSQVNAQSDVDLVLYENDCEINPLPECANPSYYPVILIYNRVFIHYPGKPESAECSHRL